MSEHERTLREVLVRWRVKCESCRWADNDHLYDTQAEAIEAYNAHVYAAAGREAVEILTLGREAGAHDCDECLRLYNEWRDGNSEWEVPQSCEVRKEMACEYTTRRTAFLDRIQSELEVTTE